MTNKATHFFQTLRGRWSFDRFISTGKKTAGTADFTQRQMDKNCLHYTETGSDFYQNYIYRLNENKITIYDRNDQKMLDLAFLYHNKGCGHYTCLEDSYTAEFTVLSKTSFNIFYTVKGPKKDYTIETKFQRITQ